MVIVRIRFFRPAHFRISADDTAVLCSWTCQFASRQFETLSYSVRGIWVALVDILITSTRQSPTLQNVIRAKMCNKASQNSHAGCTDLPGLIAARQRYLRLLDALSSGHPSDEILRTQTWAAVDALDAKIAACSIKPKP